MKIVEKHLDNAYVLALSGELMGGTDFDAFRTVIDKAIEEEQVNLVIDMAQVTWMNSSGLGMLISALTSLRSSSGDIRLANMSERLRRPMEITKLDSVFQDFSSVEKAVKSYQKSPPGQGLLNE
ncbi:MAG: STAS domain-containing protein [Calditrichaeota bacterium]|nr:STAS domain-containing protein [Calditrichota bacterium]